MADWDFSRGSQFAPKSRQRVRLTVTLTRPDATNPRNQVHGFGSYYESYVYRDGNVRFRRSHFATPPFAGEVAATASGDASFPWAYLLPWRRIVLLFVKAGVDTYVCYSDDEGETWTAPALMIADGIFPYGAVSQYDGTELIAAFLPASSKIQAYRRYAGAPDYGTPFFFRDEAGVDMLFESDCFSFWWAYEGPARLVLHARIDGESATSTWWSSDEGERWQRFV